MAHRRWDEPFFDEPFDLGSRVSPDEIRRTFARDVASGSGDQAALWIGDSLGSEYPRPMGDREQYVRYRQDRTVLAAIGAHLDPQTGRVNVRLPRSVAEAAVAAWDREELGGIGEESREECDLRDDAAELALIGLAITSRGVWDGEEVVVDLDVIQVAAASRAAR